ncbi:MAG: holo-[acyl-carrier-protein] synthase [Planctomycetota bacterium]|nr:MAG: holo-[acyl-carrier-protein] synthase [Planctomycetota bacterium]
MIPPAAVRRKPRPAIGGGRYPPAVLPQDLPGLGIDLVEVARIRAAIERSGDTFLARVFTPAEREYCAGRREPAIHYAARFAAKEAGMKALGAGFGQSGVGFQDFELLRDARGRPRLALHGAAAEIARRRGLRGLRVSITHTNGMAAAVVVAEA